MIKKKFKNFRCWWSGHKFETIESFKYKTNLFYNKVFVYRCSRCGKYCYSISYAFGLGSGALDNRYPKHKKCYESGNYSGKLSEDKYTSMILIMLSNYFIVRGTTVRGFRIL